MRDLDQQEEGVPSLNHARFGLAERRRSRTYQPWGYHGLPVLKTGWATGPVPLQGAQPSDSGLALAGRHEPAFVREDYRLHPVAEAQLREHAAEVRLHGRLAQPELARDLGVREAAGQQA